MYIHLHIYCELDTGHNTPCISHISVQVISIFSKGTVINIWPLPLAQDCPTTA